jgi:hypothetical protein
LIPSGRQRDTHHGEGTGNMAHQIDFSLRECTEVSNLLISEIRRLEDCLKACVLSGQNVTSDGKPLEVVQTRLAVLESAKRAIQ